jgi:hypothetical protein
MYSTLAVPCNVFDKLNYGGKYAYISFADTGLKALLLPAYIFDSEKLIPANQVDPFYLFKLNFLKS